MKRVHLLLVSLLPILLLIPTLAHAATYTAASCNFSDVNAVINGPTHTAANGDTIIIPAGSCTWTSELSITVGITLTGSGTPNTGPSTFGAGNPTTIITDNTSSPLIAAAVPYGQTYVLSLLDVEPEAGSTSLQSPIQVAGTCTSSGCPNMRIDNIYFGKTTQWGAGTNGGSNATWLIRSDNIFGVIDHNTEPTNSDAVFDDNELTAYLGVGGYGDNSWAQPDTFGTAQAVYMENNSLYITRSASDCEVAAAGGGTGGFGGCRSVGRFNQVTSPGGFGVFGQHGLDTGGRERAGRGIEVYGNTVTCTVTGCNIIAGFRGGTGFEFGNNAIVSNSPDTWFNYFASAFVYRTVYAPTPWGPCGGLTSLDPWDQVDNTVYFSGGSGMTASGLTITDASKNFPNLTTTGDPYSFYDVTQGFVSEIASNTATTITMNGPISESGWTGPASGDSYEIIRASYCMDQGGRGQGIYISGLSPQPVQTIAEALDPIYEWDDSMNNIVHLDGNFSVNTGRLIANRDYYTDNWYAINRTGPQAQTSPTSPFNGSGTSGSNTMGVGFGTLANRPTTCTPRVGYWATDQGSWNQSGNGFGQGELFVCTATNTWSLYYTPYTYPHPLTTGGTGATPSPPTDVNGTAQAN